MRDYLVKGCIFNIGLILITCSIYSGLKTDSFFENASTTKGRVVGFVSSERYIETSKYNSVEETVYSPVINFYTQYGEQIEFVSCCEFLSTSDVSNQVQVMYNPNDPEEAYMDRALCRTSNALGFGVMGFLLVIIGLYVLVNAGGLPNISQFITYKDKNNEKN